MEHRARVLKDIEKHGGVGGDIGKIEGNGKRSLFKYAMMGGMLFIVFILWYLNEVLSLMEQQKLLRLRYEQLGMKEGAQFQQTGVVMSPKSKSLLRTSAGFVTAKYVSKNVSTVAASSMPPDGKHLTVLPPPTTVVSAAVLKPPIITLINVSTARVPIKCVLSACIPRLFLNLQYNIPHFDATNGSTEPYYTLKRQETENREKKVRKRKRRQKRLETGWLFNRRL
jgi:hypothetical protein